MTPPTPAPQDMNQAALLVLARKDLLVDDLDALWSCEDLDLHARVMILLHPAVTPELLRRCAKHAVPQIRAEVLKNSRTTPETLLDMIDASRTWEARNRVVGRRFRRVDPLGSTETEIRVKIAHHPNATDEVLRHLGRDRSRVVQEAVARNRRSPTDTLRHLYWDAMCSLRKNNRGGRERIRLETISSAAATALYRRGVAVDNPREPHRSSLVGGGGQQGRTSTKGIR